MKSTFIHPQLVPFAPSNADISARKITLFGCALVTVMLLAFGFIGCDQIPDADCDFWNGKLPSISWIVDHDPYYRIMALGMTFYCITVSGITVRVYYDRLSHFTSSCYNGLLWWLGVTYSLAGPWINIFGHSTQIHETFTMIFFISAGVYLALFSYQVITNEDKFTD